MFNIKYHLNGGFGSYPETYTESDSITLGVPLRYGYRFIGWTGTGLSSPTAKVSIPSGSHGDREYYATESQKGCGLDPFWGWSLLAYFMPWENENRYDPTEISLKNNDHNLLLL
jgi:uncharacterized repeat protein (TIGR02543 family)